VPGRPDTQWIHFHHGEIRAEIGCELLVLVVPDKSMPPTVFQNASRLGGKGAPVNCSMSLMIAESPGLGRQWKVPHRAVHPRLASLSARRSVQRATRVIVSVAMASASARQSPATASWARNLFQTATCSPARLPSQMRVAPKANAEIQPTWVHDEPAWVCHFVRS
jgi:hypothetical protein